MACRMFLMKGMVEYGLSITGRGTELCRKTSASIRPVCGATAPAPPSATNTVIGSATLSGGEVATVVVFAATL